MKKLIIFFGYILLLSLPVLAGINYFIEYFLKQQKEDEFGKVNEIFQGNTFYDIVCFGSSRSLVQIDPHVLDSVMTSSSYNAGLDGATIIECNMLLNVFLQNHPAPSLVVLNIDTNSLKITDTTSIYNYPLYFPYIENNFVYQTISEFEPIVKPLTVLPFIRPAYYNDFKKYMAVKAFFSSSGNERNIFYKGYSPIDREWKGKPLPDNILAGYTNKGDSLFIALLETCKVHHIRPVVVYAPETTAVTDRIRNFKEFKNKLKGICASNDALFLDYSETSISGNEKYFYDYYHLNRTGSQIYSLMLSNDLKKVFLKNRN